MRCFLILCLALQSGASAPQDRKPEPDTAGVLFAEGLYAEEGRGDCEQAIALYSQLLDRFPADQVFAPRALLRRGICHAKAGRAADAERDLDRVKAAHPNHVEMVEAADRELARIKRVRDMKELPPAPAADERPAAVRDGADPDLPPLGPRLRIQQLREEQRRRREALEKRGLSEPEIEQELARSRRQFVEQVPQMMREDSERLVVQRAKQLRRLGLSEPEVQSEVEFLRALLRDRKLLESMVKMLGATQERLERIERALDQRAGERK